MAQTQDDLYIGLHWLTLNVKDAPFSVVKEAIEVVFETDLVHVGGSRFYEFRYETVDGGVTVLTGHRGDGGEMTTINISGSACEALYWADIKSVVRTVQKNGGRINVSRLDFACDGAQFSVTEFLRSLELGGIRHTAHQTQYHEKRKISGENYTFERTVEVGSRSSQRFLRVYDRRRVEGISEPVVRVELQLRDESATLFFTEYIADSHPNHGLSAFVSCISDMLKSDWSKFVLWLDSLKLMLDDLKAWKGVTALQIRTVQNKVEWLLKSVSKTLYGCSIKYPHLRDVLMEMGRIKISSSELGFFGAA